MNMKMVDAADTVLLKEPVGEQQNGATDSVLTPTSEVPKNDDATSQPMSVSLEYDYDVTGFGSDLCGALEQEPIYGPMPRPSLFDDSNFGKDITDGSAEQGIVGLYNLGNTCFMNSGLQCLFSIPRLTRFFNCGFDEGNVSYSSLTYQFSQLVSKVWSGQYTLLYPKEFKNLLGAYHPQFQDYRQHDCQEFLALLLDTLHEQLNEGCGSVKALDEASKLDEAVGGRQQSVQSEDSEILGSESHSGTHTPADRSASQSPVEAADNLPDNSNIVHSLTSTTAAPSNGGSEEASLAQGKVQYLSEDSNQSETRSETSYQSSELMPPEDHEQRMKPIPEEVKADQTTKPEPFVSIADAETEAAAFSTESNNACQKKNSVANEERMDEDTVQEKGLSLEDFYMKGTKTLNVNVVAEEYMHEVVATDSEKFHKHDNVDRPSDPFETLSDFIMNEVKCPTTKPLKDSNLLANFKEKFDPQNEAFPRKCLFSDIKNLRGEEEADWDEAVSFTTATGFCSINNIKRMKVDEDEKNVRMQARLKVNTNKYPAVPDGESSNLRLLSPGDQTGLRGEGDNNANVALNARTADAAISPLEEQIRAQNLAEAERAWKKYLEANRSVVVDTFQGQFKSTVVCSECDHVSVTYEPFMYLSVPLPHAMERQISVIFIPLDSKQPVRYLITLNRTGIVKKLKSMLLELIGDESVDLVIAEVFDNHISRILDDGQLLRYVNDYSRTLYAFEMLPPPLVEDEISGNISDDTSTITTSDAASHGSTDTLIGATNNCTVSSGSLGVGVDDASSPSLMDISSSFGEVSIPSGVHRSASEPTFVTNNHKVSSSSVPDSSELDSERLLNNLNNSVDQGWNTGFPRTEPSSSPTLLDVGFLNNFTDNMTPTSPGGGVDCEMKKDGEDAGWEATQDSEVGSTGGNYGSSTGGTPLQDPLDGLDLGGAGLTGSSWKSCAICLEEMPDSDLMVHTACGGTLCPSCLDMSCKHYGELSFMCPVCSSPVHPAEDFVQLSDAAGYKPKTRTVQNIDAKPNIQLFGHPTILYLSNNTTGEILYDTVDRVVPCFANYSVVLTDGQGLHCSRCMFTAHCTGCEVSRTGDLNLQPGDHLAVCFADLSAEQIEVAGTYIDHRSMQDLRSKDYLTLLDCFHAFTDSETLDEHNPWYCPQCKQNQCARKTMSVWRYPETLVIYLKRFVFHELSSSKIDNKVIFPLENLDLSEFISGPITNKMFYDLQGCVCHFGGINAGHYTAYAKHPVSKQWHYFNDEATNIQSPQDDDYSNAYVLFYQRQGTNIDLNLPEKCHIESKRRTSVSDDCSTTTTTISGAQFDSEKVTSLLKILQNDREKEESTADNDDEVNTAPNRDQSEEQTDKSSVIEFYS